MEVIKKSNIPPTLITPLSKNETTTRASDQKDNLKLCFGSGLHGCSYYITDGKDALLKYDTNFWKHIFVNQTVSMGMQGGKKDHC